MKRQKYRDNTGELADNKRKEATYDKLKTISKHCL